jgi:hypothetical protein
VNQGNYVVFAPRKLNQGEVEFSRNLNGRTGMKKSRYTEEQIIAILKQHGGLRHRPEITLQRFFCRLSDRHRASSGNIFAEIHELESASLLPPTNIATGTIFLRVAEKISTG